MTAAVRVANQLCDWLDAATTYREPITPRSTRKPRWQPFFGSVFVTLPAPGCMFDSNGKPSRLSLGVQHSHEPGAIITTRARARTGADATRYMVRPDRSLRKI